jgi:hypothetical protein
MEDQRAVRSRMGRRKSDFSGGFGVWLVLFVAAVSTVMAGHARASAAFVDATATLGEFAVTESWGAAARDFNGDGWTDLFVNAHRSRSYLFLNEAGTGFTDVTLAMDKSDVWVGDPFIDHHGVSWADFDNDGDQDLWLTTAGQWDAELMVNGGGYFLDQAFAYGISNDGEGRAASWLDFSGDEFVDAISHEFNFSRTKEQIPGIAFANRNLGANGEPITGFQCGPRTNHVHVADFTTDGRADVLCINEGGIDKLYDITDYADFGTPFVDVTSNMPAVGPVPDSAIGDFNNDGQMDVFLLGGLLRQAGVEIFGAANERIEGSFAASSATGLPGGFTFQGGEQIHVTVHSISIGPFRIFIGGDDTTGFNPTERTFILDSTNPMVQFDGTFNYAPTYGERLYIGYNTITGTWQFEVYSQLIVRGYIEIDNLGATGFANEVALGAATGDSPQPSSLLINNDGVFTNEANARGLGDPISCASVGVGDFDNDMDLDLYLVCRTAVSNTENLYYENDGFGNFTLVPGAGGAAGPIGAAIGDGVGTGDSVVVADFDADGFLDLFVTNGLNLQPQRVGGPQKLFRNLGNANHWMMLDLVATATSRDAIGARVFVTAGGVTQMREQDNGYHRWSQNDNRLHFGLADNSTVSLIRVEWPSGEVNEFSAVAANGIYRVTEGTGGLGNGSIAPLILPGQAGALPGPAAGDECGEPLYNFDFGPAVLVWKDCTTNTFHLRAKGGRKTDFPLGFQGVVTGDQPLASVTGVGLGASDVVDNSIPEVLDYSVNVWFSNNKGFDLDATGQSSLCFEPTAPEGWRVLVGARRWVVTEPIDLITMGPCGTATLTSADVTVDEEAPEAVVTVSLSAPAVGSVFVDYATVDGTATAGSDYVATSGTAEITDGNTSTTIVIPLIGDTLSEGEEAFSVTLSNPQGATLGTTVVTVTLIDDDGAPVCGEPVFSPSTDRGIFLWRDCTAPGPNETWHMRVTGGGGAWTNFAGSIASNALLTTVGFSIEAHDSLDASSAGDGAIDYSLFVGGSGVDGFQLTVPAGATACFNPTIQPAGAPVFVGANRQVVSGSFQLSTLGSCGATLNVADVSVDEDAAQAVVTVSLTAPASGSVFVDYATADGTATAGLDYVAVSGTAQITNGNSSTTIAIPLIGDTLVEGNETLTLTLSNPQGALIGTSVATVTLIDNDSSPACGEPAYSAAADRGLFLWRDCTAPGPNETWHMRVTGGGGAWTNFSGSVASNALLTTVGFSLEASDSLDATSAGDGDIDYSLFVGGSGEDGFELTVPPGSTTCFDPTVLPAGAQVFVGGDRQVISGSFLLSTLGPCGATMDVADVSVDEDAAEAVVTITLTAPASGSVFVDYATSDGTATAGSDYTAVSGTAEITDGNSSTTVSIPLLGDSLVEGDETLTFTLSNPQGALLGRAAATVTLIDDDGSIICGEPTFDPATDPGLFLWRDCSVGGTDEIWQVRVNGGGGAWSNYSGFVASSGLLTTVGFSLEASDSLDASSAGDGDIDYSLFVGGNGQDGFQLTVPPGVTTCFNPTTLPAGAQVYVGPGQQVVSGSFELGSLGTCQP